jgi:acylpyruvate hydrolase
VKLASFRATATSPVRVGALVSIDRSDYLADITLAYASYLAAVEGDPFADEIAAVRTPPSMLRLLEGGELSLAAAAKAARFVAEEASGTAGKARLDAAGILHRADAVRYLPPVPRPGKVISAGVNYPSHVAEVSGAGLLPKPERPVAFAKFPSILVGHDEPVIYSRHTSQLDYELELAFVIGRRCKHVPAADALDVIAGFTVFNDISMRDIQFAEMKGGILTMGKNLDTAGPVGPYLVTKDEIPDPQNLQLRLWVNGELRQNENTRHMIFTCAELVEYYSRMTLEPGDLFTTGSPAGVAIFRDEPERYLLKPGDVIEAEIERIGLLRNRVVAEEA